jgi:NAD-dependent DNA ligase
MKKIVAPTSCPCCSSPLELVNAQLFCRNITCPAQVSGKLISFAKNMGIKGMGEKTIEKLGLESIIDLYYLDAVEATEILGSKVATKLLDEIEKSKQADFATVLASMSIPLVGNTLSSKLASVINSFEDITLDNCKKAGLGDKASANLLEWKEFEYQELKDFLPFDFKEKKAVQSNLTLGTICITGKLSSFKTKAEATAKLNTLGYIVVDTLTKAVSILVDESGKGSSKRTTAEERGLQIVTDLSQFINLMEK